VSSVAPDVVYSYVPAEDEMISVDLCASSYDTKAYVYEGDTSLLIACNDDGCEGYRSLLPLVPLVAGHTYYIVVDGWSSECGAYEMVVESLGPPCFDCPPGAIDEGEPQCEYGYVDTYNGGCDADAPAFLDIACGDVICGTSGNFKISYHQLSDHDWYELTIDEPTAFQWEAIANFNVWLYVYDASQGCDDPEIIESGGGGPCENAMVITGYLEPGTYWFEILAARFDTWQCTVSEYVAQLTCQTQSEHVGACCLIDGTCIETGALDCESQYGTYSGDGTTCDEIECAPCFECPPGATPEGEPECYDGYDDLFNYGCCCHSPPLFSPLSPWETICGTSGTFVVQGSNYRDSDWFETIMEFPGVFQLSATSEFHVLIFLIDGNEGCENMTILANDAADPCDTASIDLAVDAGVYWPWIGPSVFTGVPCGAQYSLTTSCMFDDDCPEDLTGDEVVNVQDLLALLGAWEQSGVPADLDGSGTVDVGDLLMLLAAWGDC
jgi:hypothetical protein